MTTRKSTTDNDKHRVVIPWYVSNYRSITSGLLPVFLFGSFISTVAKPTWLAVAGCCICTFGAFFCLIENTKWKSQEEVEDAYQRRFINKEK